MGNFLDVRQWIEAFWLASVLMIETGVATMPTVKPLEERVARLKDRLKNDLVILGVYIYTCYIFWGGPAMNEACNKRAPLGTSSVAGILQQFLQERR